MVYFFTRAYVKIALWFFYKELSVQGLENIPEDQPVIFTPNHQNSFLDAILIACIVPRPIHYLVRASVFKSKIARWFLSSLNMMPIYRFRDGLKAVKKNDQIMSSCAEILSKNKWMMAFPEGNHDMKYAIRSLQKGTARIAFQTMDQYDKDVHIVPVGIYYEDHTASRSRVLVNIGESISAKESYEVYQKDANQGFKTLMNQVSIAMQGLTIHIAPKEFYDDIYHQWRSKRSLLSNIIDQYYADKKVLHQIEGRVEIEETLHNTTYKKNSVLLFPIYIYGVINHLFPYLILDWVITKKVTDIHFYSSIKLAFGMVLVPLFYGIQSIGMYLSGVEALWIAIYICSLPVTGMVAHRYRGFLKS